MIEIKLHLNRDTTLNELRKFVKAAEGYEGGQPVAAHGRRGELEGLSFFAIPAACSHCGDTVTPGSYCPECGRYGTDEGR